MSAWYKSLTWTQKTWIALSTIAITILGIASGDSAINILIGAIGMFYVSVYSTGARGAFLLGVVYVSFYTIICLQNRIMLDAVQNIVLIPIYIWSFVRWGKHHITPRNMTKQQLRNVFVFAIFTCVALFGLSKLLHGNYSTLDSINTTCTLFAMLLGAYGFSINWAFWSINNVVSAITFGLALFTPTGSITVFGMKLIFMINGLIGWYNFTKLGHDSQKKIAET